MSMRTAELAWPKDHEGYHVKPIIRDGKQIGQFAVLADERDELPYLLDLEPNVGTCLGLGEYPAAHCVEAACLFVENLLVKAGINSSEALEAAIDKAHAKWPFTRKPLSNIATLDTELSASNRLRNKS